MADYITDEQRKKMEAFSEGKTTGIAASATETGLSMAMSGGALGAKIGSVGGLPGAAVGAGVGLLAGGLIGGIKSWMDYDALEASQKAQMKLENRAMAEQKRQSLRERGKAGAEMERAYRASPAEVEGSPIGTGASSFDAYKARKFGG